MNAERQRIADHLASVDAERARRAGDEVLGERAQAVKQWQHARLERSYADLLATSRYGAAARFFLDDLYGPTDFTQRDRQFARIVPALVRIFPREIVKTVAALAELHALSEHFDSAMAEAVGAGVIDEQAYARAWRRVGNAPGRERQIALVLEVGTALERYTRNPLLRHSLRLMRGPAHAAGLGALQEFLERGFDTFGAMKGAQQFLGAIATRERDLAARLFAADDVALAPADAPREASPGAPRNAKSGAPPTAPADLSARPSAAAAAGSAVAAPAPAAAVNSAAPTGPGATPVAAAAPGREDLRLDTQRHASGT